MKLVIDRNTWLRGEGSAGSKLLRSRDGKQCCLGFLACELGSSQDDIGDKANPSQVPSVKWLPGMLHECDQCTPGSHVKDSDLTSTLININDSMMYASESQREADLSSAFAELGVEVEFIN